MVFGLTDGYRELIAVLVAAENVLEAWDLAAPTIPCDCHHTEGAPCPGCILKYHMVSLKKAVKKHEDL